MEDRVGTPGGKELDTLSMIVSCSSFGALSRIGFSVEGWTPVPSNVKVLRLSWVSDRKSHDVKPSAVTLGTLWNMSSVRAGKGGR